MGIYLNLHKIRDIFFLKLFCLRWLNFFFTIYPFRPQKAFVVPPHVILNYKSSWLPTKIITELLYLYIFITLIHMCILILYQIISIIGYIYKFLDLSEKNYNYIKINLMDYYIYMNHFCYVK